MLQFLCITWCRIDFRLNFSACIFQFLIHSHDIVVFENTIYWTDREEHKINMCDKFNCSTKYTSQNPLLLNPIGITVYHPLRQPEGNKNILQKTISFLWWTYPHYDDLNVHSFISLTTYLPFWHSLIFHSEGGNFLVCVTKCLYLAY